MSVHVNISIIKIIWFYLIILSTACFNATSATPFYPAIGDWECNAGHVLMNQTISGGIQAGQFKKVGFVKDITQCIKYCCNEEKCHVALFSKQNCFLVSCNNQLLCRPVAAESPDLVPQISYVTHTPLHPNTGHIKALKTFLATKENFLSGKENIGFIEQNKDQRKIISENNPLAFRSSFDENGQKRRVILDRYPKSSPTKAEMFFKEQGFQSTRSMKKSKNNQCFPSEIRSSVSLRYGPDSGDFYDYGEIGDMKQCINLCCKDKLCDVAFMVGKTCYTVSCYSFEKCQMIPASKKAKLKSQLAYVIKKSDSASMKKLKLSREHEQNLERQMEENSHSSELQTVDNNSVSDDTNGGETTDSNIPEEISKKCKHAKVLKNHALVGGQRAGIYTFRGITPGFFTCLELCCADLFCDAAFLLGKRCYSVQCYKNGQCSSRLSRSKRLHSSLVFVQRTDDLDASEKRTAIPRLLPTDQQFSIWLNITNQEYKDEMVDIEALEFLNIAEKVQGAISDIYGTMPAFKYVEVLALKAKVLRAKINITVDKTGNPKELLQKMVDVLRNGELKLPDDPKNSRLNIDVRGFKFLNDKGENMICPPEYNFEVHWPLGVYESFVSVPCPRKAVGLTTRQCHGSGSMKATWSPPDFSDCVTNRYEKLLQETQLLTTSAIHTPDLSSASVIDRLLQLVTSDTYGSEPPSEFESINNLEEVEPLPKQNILEKEAGNSQIQIPFVKSSASMKESLSSDQLKNYLHKMGLSALLGKTNQPDMLSLYKSLSSRNNDLESMDSSHILKEYGNKYPHKKPEAETINIIKKNPHLHANRFHKGVVKGIEKATKYRPVNIQRITDTIKIPSANTLQNGRNSDAYWSQQKPTGDLGAESPPGQAMIKAPADTINELVPASQIKPGSELQMIENKHTFLSPFQPVRPASIKNVDFEPVARSNPSPPKMLDLIPDYLNDIRSSNTRNQYQETPSSLPGEPGELPNLGRKNLYNYYSNSLYQPNGIPMYESRRDSTLHPSQILTIPHYPSHAENLAGASAIINSIRRKRSIDQSRDEYDYLDGSVGDNLRSRGKREIDKANIHNLDSAIVQFFAPKSKRPSKNIKRINDHVFSSHTNVLKSNMKPAYVKKIEKPLIIDIPTGNIVSGMSHSQKSTISAVVDSGTQYDASTQEKVVSTAMKTPNIQVQSQADILHDGKKSGKGKVQTNIDVNCYGEDCVRKISSGKPAVDSQVINEVQVAEGSNQVSQPNQQNQPEQTQKNQQSQINSDKQSVQSTKAPILTTIKPSAKPPAGPVEDKKVESVKPNKSKSKSDNKSSKTTTEKPVLPVEQDNTETEPESESQAPQSKDTSSRPENKDDKHKPVISITVVNKTDEVSIGSTIDTSKKPTKISKGEKPKDEKQEKPKEEQKEKDKNKEKEKPKEESNLIFTYDREEGKARAPMFGGDIMLTVDIIEQLAKYAETQTSGPTLVEIEELLQTASALIDENNDIEWKHAIQHLRNMASEEEDSVETRDTIDDDRLDWRVLHKQKSIDKHNLLLGFVDTVEDYGKSVSGLFSRYSSKFQQPIITKNIIMQIRIIVVEELLDKRDEDLFFPEYSKDARLNKWSSGVERVSIPNKAITSKFESTKTVHVTYFRFKNIAEIQRPSVVEDESEAKVILDASPTLVGSQILSMSIDPPLGDKLKEPLSLTFANNDLTQDKYPHFCAYWNATENSFKRNGCKLVFQNSSVTMCECTHMTTFAVLVDTSKESGKEIDVSKPKEKPVEKPITEEPATDSEKENKPPSDNEKENKVTSDGDKAEIDKEKEKVKEEKPEMEEPSSKPLENEPPAVEEEPATTKPTDTSAATAAFIYTTTLPPQYTKQKLTKENFFKSKWFWILLLALLLLLLLLLICLLCCCCWRRRKKKQVSEETVEQKDIGSVSSGPDTLQTTEHIIDKSREKLDPKKGPVTPGSTVSSRTTSPEPGQSPGWRKFMSHAQHPKQILLKEKALLFKDYVQPYHFLSEKEPPNTSVESIYGSTVTSYPQTGASDVSSGKVLSPKRKRNYEPKHRRERVAPVLKERLEEKSVNSDDSDFTPEKKTNTINEKPKSLNVNKPVQVKKQPVNDKVKATEVIASQMTEATSMEWDPYLESKQKLNKKNGPSPPRRKRNISPISEEDEDLANSKPSQDVSKTTAGQDNSRAQSDNQDSPVSSETSYMESVSGSTKTGNESSEASSPYIRKNTAVRMKDNDSSESRSSFVPAERKRSVTSTTTSDSSESDSPVLRRQPRHYQERKYADKSSSPLTGKRQDKNTSTSDMLSPHERRRERSPHLLDKNRDSKNANNR